MSAATSVPYAVPKPVPTRDAPLLDMQQIIVGEWARDRLLTIASTSRRSMQAALGASEIGQECARRLAYRIVGTPMVNLPDPLKAMIGTGFHVAAAEGMARLDLGTGRHLIEHPVRYRGVPGTVDLYDRYKGLVVDWKTSSLRRIKRYRSDGPPSSYLIQASIYAEGLRAAGEDVRSIALVFVPRDGDLTDVWAWTTTPNKALADEWIDRYESIARTAQSDGPAAVAAKPSGLCTYCPNYRPRAADLTTACPGEQETENA